MKRVIALVVLWASLSFGQGVHQDIDHLENAINSGDWAKASELSRSLKERVADARNQSLAVGGKGLVDSILASMPRDTEMLLVAQEPFRIARKCGRSYILGLLTVAEEGSYPSWQPLSQCCKNHGNDQCQLTWCAKEPVNPIKSVTVICYINERNPIILRVAKR